MVFRCLQAVFGSKHSDVWLHVKSLNSYILATILCLTALAQYPFTLVVFLIAFIQMGLSPLLPSVTASEFTFKSYSLSALKSAIWLIWSVALVYYFLFGTICNDIDFGLQIKDSLKQFMLDYECMGSRVWSFLLAIVVPNIVLTVKILTN